MGVNVFDVAIIGLGVGGTFAINKLATQHKNIKILGIEFGRPPQKRRQQMCGFFGLLPSSDGKLFLNDINNVANIVGPRKAKLAHTYLNNLLNQIDDFKIIKDRRPSISIEKRIKKQGYTISLNDHIQMYPKQIHMLSKYIANNLDNKNIVLSFDNEAQTITKQRGIFIITTENGQEFRCKKLIIAAGRSGWRWTNNLYKNFGIIEDNDTARFGIRIEANANVLKDFNKSNCSLFKDNDLEIGPLSWYGTVIPEDYVDMAISSFRSNEARWKTNKVSFQFIGNRSFPSNGFEQADRLAKLTFLIANDRIVKERVSSLLSGRSKLSILKEYDWLKESLIDFAKVVPEILTKAYFHLPTIVPLCSQINIGNNLESDIDGMYIIGESSGVRGLLAASLTGLIAADEVCK